MSVEMYLKLDGISGGSRNYTYKGWSDVHSWRWEMLSNRGSAEATGIDKTSFKEISITKPISTDSTAIMLLYAQGKIVPCADLNIIPVLNKREAKQKYLAMRMEGIVVKSIITGGNTSEDSFNETIVLIFNSIRFEYNCHTASTPGADNATSVDYTFAWDIARNKEWQPAAA
jgi:type VI secretion system secreted protein Hcp